MKSTPLFITTILTVLLLGPGCKTAYYSAMETVGVQKYDIMVDRIEDVSNVQTAATKQFKDALSLFMEVVDVNNSDLHKLYNKLKKEFENCEKRAREVNDRIAKVESVSKALFKEWKSELKQYSNPELRRSSEAKMKTTQARYHSMMASMKKSAATMDPVLANFRDQVLFLKHNLNSQAIAGIQGEAARVQADVTRLIADMQASINEAESFIRGLESR